MTVVITRYLYDGTLDQQFGEEGFVFTNFPTLDIHEVFDLVVNRQDQITVVAGGSDLHIARYEVDGTPILTFGQQGQVNLFYPFTPSDAALEVLDQLVHPLAGGIPDRGDIIPPQFQLLGAGSWPGSAAFRAARYRGFDNLDPTFGGSGISDAAFQYRQGRVSSVRRDKSGNVLVAGSATRTDDESIRDFALARFDPTGHLDQSFNASGMVTTEFGNQSGEIRAIAISGSGSIWAAGDLYDTQRDTLALTRYTSSGDLDETFGAGGKVSRHINARIAINDLASDGSGNLILAGSTSGSPSLRYLLARFAPSGEPDSTFGDHGLVTGWFMNDTRSAISAVTVNVSDDTITAVGSAGQRFGLARHARDGSLDALFGSHGLVTTTVPGIESHQNAVAQQVRIDSQQRIVVAGIVAQPVA